jgi:hypothetical protein
MTVLRALTVPVVPQVQAAKQRGVRADEHHRVLLDRERVVRDGAAQGDDVDAMAAACLNWRAAGIP